MANAKKKPQPETADEKQVVMLHSINVPLDTLVPWQGNVRKTESMKGIDEMAASILAHGLIQSLVVREVGQGKDKGKFELITGRRRYTALMQLAAQGKIAEDYKVPCQLIAAEASAHEIGLAENTVRVEMNPADQFEAFHQLTTEGKTVADIAGAFGVSETVVNKRLKLANVAPVIINAYRDGILNLEQLQAFSVTDDKKAQKRLFEFGDEAEKIEDLADYWEVGGAGTYWDKDGKWIRKQLTAGKIRGTDKFARFVGVDSYEAAGGKVERDLFVDDINGIYFLDAKLLNKLAEEKMISLQGQVKAEGWQWVNADLQGYAPSEYRLRETYVLEQPRSKKPSPEAQAKIDALEKQQEKIAKPFLDEYGDVVFDDNEDAEREYDALEEQIDQIRNDAVVYAKKTIENGGAVIGLTYHGTPIIIRGLIDKKTAKALEKQSAKKKADNGEDAPEETATVDETDDLAKHVLTDLSVHRTFAIGATLMQNPEAGLVNLLYPMALKAFYDGTYDLNNVKADITETAIPALVDTHTTDMNIHTDEYPVKGYAMLQRAKDKWMEKIPAQETELWQYMMGLKLADLAELAALFAGLSYSNITTYGPQSLHDKILMQKFNIDMTKWYAPGEQNLFKRLTKTQLASVIKDIRGTPLTPDEMKLKRDGMAALAAAEEQKRTEAGNPWLPLVLRTPTDEDVTAAQNEWTELYGDADDDGETEEGDEE